MVVGTAPNPREDGGRIRDALQTLRRVTGLPVAFGGLVGPDRMCGTGAGRSQVRISELTGTTTDALRGLAVTSGFGLGGKALALALPLAVSDYPAARTISHEYDGAVITEGLRSVLAVPIVVRRVVRAVLYGAVRQPLPFGDRVVSAAVAAAREVEQDLAVRDDIRQLVTSLQVANARAAAAAPSGVPPAAGPTWEEIRQIHAELRALTQRVTDPELKDQLYGLSARLADASQPDRPSTGRDVSLSPRELDVLACVAVGCTNADAARQLGLLPETVKSYLRSAMRKLGAHTRLEAVVAARRAGLLP